MAEGAYGFETNTNMQPLYKLHVRTEIYSAGKGQLQWRPAAPRLLVRQGTLPDRLPTAREGHIYGCSSVKLLVSFAAWTQLRYKSFGATHAASCRCSSTATAPKHTSTEYAISCLPACRSGTERRRPSTPCPTGCTGVRCCSAGHALHRGTPLSTRTYCGTGHQCVAV